jgi:thiosulfate/3-mercaptopyruvate sulfurtransferase
VEPLVDPAWLASRLAEPDLRVVDLRWSLDPAKRGIDLYRSGHVPGAVFMDLDRDLAGPGGGKGSPLGRHPWAPEDQVARVMGAAGIGAGTRVVVYDEQAGAYAARLWYVLRAHGHDAVAVLDGGLPRWEAEGRPLERGERTVAPAVFTGRLRPGFLADKAELARPDPARLVLDARAAPRYRGETEPIDARAGHLPGARNAPFEGNLTPGPLPVLRPPDELRARYVALGADRTPPVVYCGSGVTACHDLLALHLAGLSGRLYPGSWSEWSADPALPIEIGEGPSPER